MGILIIYTNMAARPLNRRKIVKKIARIPRRFQSHEYKRVNPDSHRAIRGIDCSTRRRFKGRQPEKMFIGHKQDKKTRFLLPNGFKNFLISSEQENLLRNYCPKYFRQQETQNRPKSKGDERQTHQRPSQGKKRNHRVNIVNVALILY